MRTEKVPSYYRKGKKVKGYKRPVRKKSGKTTKQRTNYGLGVVRDTKTGYIVGTYKYRLGQRR